jgi:hypothetical protein
MLITPSHRILPCEHYWSMLGEEQRNVVREQWRLLTAEVQAGARGIQLERNIAQALKAMTARMIDFPMEVLCHGVSKAAWHKRVDDSVVSPSPDQTELMATLIDVLGWVDLARELGDLYMNNRPMPRGPSRTLWEMKHGLESATARVESCMIMMRRLELSTLGYDSLTKSWRAVEARMAVVRPQGDAAEVKSARKASKQQPSAADAP